MEKLLLPFSLYLLLFSCKAQNTVLTFHNRSGNKIDSLYFPHLKKSYVFELNPASSKSLTIDISGEKNVGESGINGLLYSTGKIFPFSFCENFAGIEDDNNIYLFPNETKDNDMPQVKPTEFDLFIQNRSNDPIDSVRSVAEYRPFYKMTDSLIKMYLEFDPFSRNPEVYVYQKGEKYIIKVDHPWDTWNYTSVIYNFYDNGLSVKDPASVIGKR